MHNWKVDIEIFKDAVAKNHSIAGVIKALGLKVGGANYKMVKSRIKQLSLDTSHWLGQAHLRGKRHDWSTKRPLHEILVEDSDYLTTSSLKRRLYREGLLEERCYECDLTEWRGKPISLQLEHKNGINDDNRLENLTVLCPNCHSQTPTFAGKNRGVWSPR